MSNSERAMKVATYIADHVVELQGGARKWKGATGQWVIYGLERQFGFGRCCELLSACEANWKNKVALTESINALVLGWLDGSNKGKPEV